MPSAGDKDKWLSEMTLAKVFAMMKGAGATEVLFKVLRRNNNSKNQIYLAPDLSDLGHVPSGEVTMHEAKSKKKAGLIAVFHSAVDFHWIGQNGEKLQAPGTKLIFYPQYPEVRLSGFLVGSRGAPSSLLDRAKRGQEPGRILVLGVGNGRAVSGLVLPPEAPAATEIQQRRPSTDDILFSIPMPGEETGDAYSDLLRELCLIHRREWVNSMRLDRDGKEVPSDSSNGVGNTLEALLGIRSNGFSNPDFRGWEVKARSVSNCEKPGASVVTLMTPEPNDGLYVQLDRAEFMRRYGYKDTKGRPDRINFGGTYCVGGPLNKRTKTRLILEGFEAKDKTVRPTGAVRLLDEKEREVMTWTFAKLVDHWKKKHSQAVYVPAQLRKAPGRQYKYGRGVLICRGADFGLLLSGLNAGLVYYDPGIKMEEASTLKPKHKKRNQFRLRSRYLPDVYEKASVVDTCQEDCC